MSTVEYSTLEVLHNELDHLERIVSNGILPDGTSLSDDVANSLKKLLFRARALCADDRAIELDFELVQRRLAMFWANAGLFGRPRTGTRVLIEFR